MPPPPRPPIICYDLQTNCNARRSSCARYRVPASCVARKTKVTVVQREPQSSRAGTSTCWHHPDLEVDNYEDETENVPKPIMGRLPNECKQTQKRHESHFQRQKLLYSEPYKFRREILPPKVTTNSVRHAYGQKLRVDVEERERRQEQRKERLAMVAKLEEIEAELESLKRWHRDLAKTFGMSHNTAKYIQKQDEEFANLKKKVDQFSEYRSRALCRRVQEAKQIPKAKPVDEKPRDMSVLSHCKQALSSTLNNSLNTNPTNTASSSSTISISSCSSSATSSDENRFLQPSPKTTHDSRLSRQSIPKSFLNQQKPQDKFSFYKLDPKQANETLEVTDIDFFDKVEDKTMLEVNELMNRLKNLSRDSLR